VFPTATAELIVMAEVVEAAVGALQLLPLALVVISTEPPVVAAP
jgi:hypothetical protein